MPLGKAPPQAPPKAHPKPPAKVPVPPSKAPPKAPAAPPASSSKISPTKAPKQAPLNKCTPNKFKSKRGIASGLDALFKRDSREFIGWDGTNSATAAFWKAQGKLAKSTQASGFFDFFGLAPSAQEIATKTSGADAENGPGLYTADDAEVAISFANNNAQFNNFKKKPSDPVVTPALCAIFAKSSANWRTALRKVFLHEVLVGDSSDPAKKAAKETSRTLYIKQVMPGVSPAHVVRFSLFNRQTLSGQLVLPDGITDQFEAVCVDAASTTQIPGTARFPIFSYNSQRIRTVWHIAAEQQCSV